MERRRDSAKREHFQMLRRELLNRLRRVCHAMSREELDQLTARMTRLRLKYEQVTALPEEFANR